MTSLQESYDGGNEIQAGQPVVIKVIPGLGSIAGHDAQQALKDALLVASGVSQTQGLEPYTAIGPGFIALHGSGVGGGSMAMESLKAPLIGQATLMTVDGKLIVFANGSQILISQNNTEALISLDNGSISLQAFNGQGQLEYRLGPYESWQVKNINRPTAGPLGDGWLPIPNSGQIEQMINEAVIRGIKQHKSQCHPSGC